MSLLDDVTRVARENRFSGVVRVERDGVVEFEVAHGHADRAHRVANTIDTRFGTASAAKGFTALTVMSLIADGRLTLDTPARDVLGADLALIGGDVTIEHLLGHRSGIGDYLDEETLGDVDAYVLAVPVHRLATSEDFLAVLDGFPPKFPAGTAFSYCNGGYVVLAIIAERVSATPFHELVHQRVCIPAGLTRTAFLRSDELPGDVAVGYVTMDGAVRSNVFHLPVRGSGDGGIHTTLEDMSTFWRALGEGRIVSPDAVAEMVRPRSATDDGRRYGLGFWLHPATRVVFLEGMDAGVSFRSVHDPTRAITHTVMSNTSDGAWAVSRLLGTALATS
jgi:CubicO group peptidase (beta-lactamase class C family)